MPCLFILFLVRCVQEILTSTLPPLISVSAFARGKRISPCYLTCWVRNCLDTKVSHRAQRYSHCDPRQHYSHSATTTPNSCHCPNSHQRAAARQIEPFYLFAKNGKFFIRRLTPQVASSATQRLYYFVARARTARSESRNAKHASIKRSPRQRPRIRAIVPMRTSEQPLPTVCLSFV